MLTSGIFTGDIRYCRSLTKKIIRKSDNQPHRLLIHGPFTALVSSVLRILSWALLEVDLSRPADYSQ